MSLIGVACLAAAMLVGALIRRRQGLARLEKTLRTLRALAVSADRVRPLRPGELDTSQLDTRDDQLRSLGFSILGDAHEEWSTGEAHAMRWFADAAGTTFGWIGQFRGLWFGFLMSGSADRIALTRIAPRRIPVLAQPPFLDRYEHFDITKLGDALAEHRERVPASAAKVSTLEAALAEMCAMRARAIAWREAEPPADLLDRDLRAILGRHYPRLGAIMARRLGVTLPEARVRAT